MTDKTTATTTTTATAGPTPAELDAKIGRVETAVQTILTALHGKSQEGVQAKLDAPGSVAEEVQRELARRDAQKQKDEHDAEFTGLKETVAKLTEQKPVDPPRKIEQLMGWHG